jgi:RecA-family ATPase
MSAELATKWPDEPEQPAREKRIRFFRPSELRGYMPDEHTMLVGNCHIIRGEVFVIGGEPGIGKSIAATELAFCGATGSAWLGLPVHYFFKTMIVQAENGRYRLMQEYQARGEILESENLIRVSEPPPYGLTLSNSEFLADVQDALAQFQPDVVILDPWNAAVKDDKQHDYSEAFDALRALLPKGDARPALGIVAHTRKPKADEKRTGGTGLMHLLAEKPHARKRATQCVHHDACFSRRDR